MNRQSTELETDAFGADFFGVDSLLDTDEPESDDAFDDESDELLVDAESDELLESPELEEPDGVVDEDVPRLSFLKKPLPLKVTPTGWNTFLTGITAPESGWVNSDSVSSWNDCCTSIVSPVSTNL